MRFPQKIPLRKTIILAFVSVLIIFIIFKSLVNVDDFSRIIRGISWFYFYVAFAMLVPSFILSVARWHLVLRASGFNISFWKIFKIIGSSISLSVVPGRLGDFARSYPLRNKIPVSQSVGTIILEKIIDISVLIIFSGIGLFILGYSGFAFLMFFLAIASIPLIEIFNILTRKIKLENSLVHKIHEAASILNKVKERKTILFLAIITSGVNWTVSMLMAYWLFKAIGASVPFYVIYAFYPLSIFAGLLPITLAGIGTRDSAIIYFFSNFATSGQSLAVGILYSLQAYWITALLGVPLLYYFFRDKN